jgi:hypothetical protein
MPIVKCIVKGKSGHKFGETGKCYTGKGSKNKASMQAKAIKSSKSYKSKRR